MVRVRKHLRCHAARACNDSSIAMSGVSERSRNGYLSEYLCASQRAARSGVLAASALSKRRHVPPRLPHEPYGRPLSRCEARRQMDERSVARAGSAPSPRATRSRSGSPAVVCAACGARTLRRARVRGGRAASGASGASRTHAMRGGSGRPQRMDGARQAWAGRRRADTQKRGERELLYRLVLFLVVRREAKSGLSRARRRTEAGGAEARSRLAAPLPEACVAHGAKRCFRFWAGTASFGRWPPRHKALRSPRAREVCGRYLSASHD